MTIFWFQSHLPSPHSTSVRSSLVAVGSDIYEIGGIIYGVPSSSIWFWTAGLTRGTRLQTCRWPGRLPSADLIDGKMLVKGGIELKDLNSANWVEFFDPNTQTWTTVSFTCGSKEWQSEDNNGIAWHSSSCCLIDDVVYCFDYEKLKWFVLDMGS